MRSMTPASSSPLTWIEIDTAALRHNIGLLREVSERGGARPLLCAMVKGNAYGHGLLLTARVFVEAGVDWLGVADVGEALALREAGIELPLLAVAPIGPGQMEEAVACDLALTVAEPEVVRAAGRAVERAGRLDRPLRLHLKLETGMNRQGLRRVEALELAGLIEQTPGVRLEGVSTHFADIDDTTDHRFARGQLRRFRQGVEAIEAQIRAQGGEPSGLLAHASNTAALLLWPEVRGALVRFGLGAYGLWPSKETFLTAQQLVGAPIELRPALGWKTTVAQVKEVPSGEFVGYGRSARTLRHSRLAVLPVGYYDGYDRGLGNRAQVLVRGRRAPVVGRVSMNVITIDVTEIPGVSPGDEVVLLGSQAPQGGGTEEVITADELATHLGTINYEVVTRIQERLPRIMRRDGMGKPTIA